MPPEPWVLLVDDDLDGCELLADILRRHGFATRCVGDGADAIALLDDIQATAGELPRAIVTDLLMPGIIGTSVIDYLRSDPTLARIPVAIVTAAPYLAPAGHLLLPKPLDVSALLGFLNAHIVKSMTPQGGPDVRR